MDEVDLNRIECLIPMWSHTVGRPTRYFLAFSVYIDWDSILVVSLGIREQICIFIDGGT